MSHDALLERRSEILKRNIHQLILRDNQKGLSYQDGHFLQQMIKEFHQNEHELKTSK